MAPLKVLVTGACGLIGLCVYRHLRAQPARYEVYALDRARQLSDRVPEGERLDIPGDQFFEVDLIDREGVERAVAGMDVVVHLAADPSEGAWESLRDNNLIGAYHVFEACHRAGVRRLVAASSNQVVAGYEQHEPYRSIAEGRFDDLGDVPVIGHRDPAEPRTVYAATKLWAEALAKVYVARGMSCLIVRPGWVTAEDRPRIPERSFTWCSQRDIVQLIECCILAGEDVKFGLFTGVSDNRWRWVDLDHARHQVGYIPRDRAEDRT